MNSHKPNIYSELITDRFSLVGVFPETISQCYLRINKLIKAFLQNEMANQTRELDIVLSIVHFHWT